MSQNRNMNLTFKIRATYNTILVAHTILNFTHSVINYNSVKSHKY